MKHNNVDMNKKKQEDKANIKPKQTNEKYGKNQFDRPIPEFTSSLCSRLFFTWMDPLFHAGYDNLLTDKYVWYTPKHEESKIRVIQLEEYYDQELKRTKHFCCMKRHPFLRALIRFRLSGWVLCSFLKFFGECLAFTQPILLSLILDYIESKYDGSTDGVAQRYGISYALFLVFLMVGLLLVRIVEMQYYVNLTCAIGISRKNAMSGLIFRKSLELSYIKGGAVGQAINLIGNDAEKMSFGSRLFQNFWWQPTAMIISLFFLSAYIGIISALVALAFILILFPVQIKLAEAVTKLRRKLLVESDKRVSLLNSIIEGIRAIKLLAWEGIVMGQVNKVREKELKELKSYMILSMLNYLFLTITPLLIAAGTFATYSLLGNEIKASTAFTTLTLLNMLRKPLYMFPRVLNRVLDGLIGVERAQKFLHSLELDRIKFSKAENENDVCISLKNCSFSWSLVNEIDLSAGSNNNKKKKKEKSNEKMKGNIVIDTKSNKNNEDVLIQPTLKNINLNVNAKQLILIYGSVGSGKSTLFNSILGECPRMNIDGSNIDVKGSVSYVSQVPFVLNDTLRENIIFGNAFDMAWYRKVIKACALEPDLEQLSEGDSTEIGESGINLSGGQKMRVSLARAVYANSQIYLLDDPLAAVDAHVAKHIFDNVISNNGLLGNKLRLLTCHQQAYMKAADRLILLESSSEQVSACEIIENKTPAEAMQDGKTNSKLGNLMYTWEETYATTEEEDEKQQEQQQQSPTTPTVSSSLLSTEKKDEGKSKNSNKITEETKVTDIVIKEQLKYVKKTIEKGKLITKEDQAEGAVSKGTWLAYYLGLGKALAFSILITFVIREGSKLARDIWMSEWADTSDANTNGDKTADINAYYVQIYILFAFIALFVSVIRSILLVFASIRAAKKLFADMFHSIMRAPMSWFDTTPTGRILSRLSSDVEKVDDKVPQLLRDAIDDTFKLIGVIVLVSILTPTFLILVPFVGGLYYRVQLMYRRTTRELKRYASTRRSPIMTNFKTALTGLPVISAIGDMDRWIKRHDDAINDHNRFYYLNLSCSRWANVRFEIMTIICILFVGIYVIVANVSAGIAGASLMNIMLITRTLTTFVRTTVDLELAMNSVERVDYYTSYLPEESQKQNQDFPDVTIPKKWPYEGNIIFDKVSLRYREGLDNSLENLSFNIPAGSRVGIVGRTGAGKSTIALALFRMVEIHLGNIIIDDLNVQKMSLFTLRRSLSIVPQVPTLFSGTLRSNIDCDSKYSDDKLLDVLGKVDLAKHGLDSPVDLGGTNWSVGERQLICLARAILLDSKVLLLDECSASIDPETDAILQKMIRIAFTNCTVLTIAHRLDTVIDSDYILVMDKGSCVEFGSPQELLKDKDGLFTSLYEKFNLKG